MVFGCLSQSLELVHVFESWTWRRIIWQKLSSEKYNVTFEVNKSQKSNWTSMWTIFSTGWTASAKNYITVQSNQSREQITTSPFNPTNDNNHTMQRHGSIQPITSTHHDVTPETDQSRASSVTSRPLSANEEGQYPGAGVAAIGRAARGGLEEATQLSHPWRAFLAV